MLRQSLNLLERVNEKKKKMKNLIPLAILASNGRESNLSKVEFKDGKGRKEKLKSLFSEDVLFLRNVFKVSTLCCF